MFSVTHFYMKKDNFMEDASLFVDALEMCGCGYFSTFSFYYYFLFDPYSYLVHLYEH